MGVRLAARTPPTRPHSPKRLWIGKPQLTHKSKRCTGAGFSRTCGFHAALSDKSGNRYTVVVPFVLGIRAAASTSSPAFTAARR